MANVGTSRHCRMNGVKTVYGIPSAFRTSPGTRSIASSYHTCVTERAARRVEGYERKTPNSAVDISRKTGTITVVRRAEIAQLVEHLTENQGVPSSSLGLGTTFSLNSSQFQYLETLTVGAPRDRQSSFCDRRVLRSTASTTGILHMQTGYWLQLGFSAAQAASCTHPFHERGIVF